jgi:hypothetical protein
VGVVSLVTEAVVLTSNALIDVKWKVEGGREGERERERVRERERERETERKKRKGRERKGREERRMSELRHRLFDGLCVIVHWRVSMFKAPEQQTRQDEHNQVDPFQSVCVCVCVCIMCVRPLQAAPQYSGFLCDNGSQSESIIMSSR